MPYYPRVKSQSAAFTLIEMLVVAAIIALLGSFLFFNFRSTNTNRTARNEVVSTIISDVRRAESMSTSSTLYNGNTICGFGVHYVSSTSYLIYAGAQDVSGGTPTCKTISHNYQSGVSYIVETDNIGNPNFNIKAVFPDIFFEPPNPKIYVNNNAALSQAPSTITVGALGVVCGGGNCSDIIVRTSGALDNVDN